MYRIIIPIFFVLFGRTSKRVLHSLTLSIPPTFDIVDLIPKPNWERGRFIFAARFARASHSSVTHGFFAGSIRSSVVKFMDTKIHFNTPAHAAIQGHLLRRE